MSIKLLLIVLFVHVVTNGVYQLPKNVKEAIKDSFFSHKYETRIRMPTTKLPVSVSQLKILMFD